MNLTKIKSVLSNLAIALCVVSMIAMVVIIADYEVKTTTYLRVYSKNSTTTVKYVKTVVKHRTSAM